MFHILKKSDLGMNSWDTLAVSSGTEYLPPTDLRVWQTLKQCQ